MYHKVFTEAKTVWWVDSDSFYRQMVELSSKKVVYLDQYDPLNPQHVVISFDGVYKNVLEYAAPILEHFGYPFELFVTGGYIGASNEFDVTEPYAQFAGVEDLARLIALGGRLQWHTVTHKDMLNMSSLVEITNELTIPYELIELDKAGFKWFAYPNGNFNDAVINELRKKFVGALSCDQGNEIDVYKLNRITVTNNTKFVKRKISVVVPSYNYGSFLSEALESIIRQTIIPDEVIIADDASEDITGEVAKFYTEKYNGLVSYYKNHTNLGPIGNFNKAVAMAKGDYICIIGADNRIIGNYIEKCAIVLDSDENIAIAYTDYALFGPRAEIAYQNYSDDVKAGSSFGLFIINFPNFTDVDLEYIRKQNIFHGSSMFRKKAFIDAGGYVEEKNMPEDQNLFLRIIHKGWLAKKAANTFLEYRQHSRDQLNEKTIALFQLNFYKMKSHMLEKRLEMLTKSRFIRLYLAYLELLKKVLARIHSFCDLGKYN
jgi:glycosyltransferase involved in cell wall biosynthesis/peptidoglycan/xylan/chitin deacetylase (PgdA/CDA1 family)